MPNHNQTSQFRASSNLTENVKSRECPRDYRTEIPNIVDDMVSCGDITTTDFLLYHKYRRIAGEHGSCFKSLRTLAAELHISKDTITRARNNLSKSFSKLNGKSLIEIIPGNYKLGQADTIIIEDIWHENYEWFLNKKATRELEKSNNSYLSHGKDRGVSPQGHKKEPFKKEPINSDISEGIRTGKVAEPSRDSLASFDADLAFEEIIKQQALPENKVAVSEIVALNKKHGFKIKPPDIQSWLKKHGPYVVLETLKLLIQRYYSKQGVSDEVRWMQSALTKQFVKKERNRKENLAWAELFIQDYDYKDLEIKNKYCIDPFIKVEVCLETDPETFKDKIKHFHERNVNEKLDTPADD